MGPKEPRRKSVRTLPDRWSRYFFIATWMLLFWSGQVQAGEIRGVQTLAPLVGKLLQSVVGIKATMMEAPLASPPTDTAPGLPGGPSPRASDVFGAGVIIGAEAGLIVTSRHVVSGAKTLSVQLSDGRQLDAEFVVSDERYDLAMLRISASGLTAASIGRSIEAKPGDFVLAVGAPRGPLRVLASALSALCIALDPASPARISFKSTRCCIAAVQAERCSICGAK